MDVYRAITITLALVALLVWVFWLRKHPHRWGYAVGILTIVGSVLIFNLSILIVRLSGGEPDPTFFNHWSHVNYWLILIYIIAFALLWWANGKSKVEEKARE